MADLFEEKAKDWDVNEMVLALSSAIGSAIKEQIELNETMHVMDFGAGTGLVTAQVAEKVGKVTAVDVSQSMLDQLVAKEHLELKVDTVCQNILELPLDTCQQRFRAALETDNPPFARHELAVFTTDRRAPSGRDDKSFRV